MAPRRGASSNSLSPPDFVPSPGAPSPGSVNSARSVSPSAGFTQFLSKPTRWFNRSNSGSGGGRSSISSNEPRSSTSSTGRKPKISHPTDPRPILDNLLAEKSGVAASRSVLDLSLSRNTPSMDSSARGSPRTPSSPSHPAMSRGLGDLRNMSRKAWSRSADDLGKFSPTSTPALTPIDTVFNDRIERYRGNRNNDSLGSISNVPSPSASSVTSLQGQKNFPFPTIMTSESLSSSPPQYQGMLPPTPSPISNSPPALTSADSSSSSGSQVHARSHSFTPRLPSKLAAAKGLIPSSPSRKNSANAEQDTDRQREKTTSSGSTGSGASVRSPFPFKPGAGGSKAPSPLNTALAAERGGSAAPTPTMLTPSIVEPDGDKYAKRTSQVVYHSGFVNRLVSFSPTTTNARATQAFTSGSGAPTLAKGWKPFKLVLKGSKLYFFKPPSDRSAAIKELFPTELVVVLEDEGLSEAEPDALVVGEPEEGGRGGKGKEREEMRRRRAYWGRTTHPSLGMSSDGRIDRGTFEALAIEGAEGESEPNAQDPPHAEDEKPRADAPLSPRYRPEWRDFSAAVLLALPSLTERPKFEAEFMRCCSFLISGAEDDAKEEETARVSWLVGKYLDYHGPPANSDSWEKWQADMLPGSLPKAKIGPRLAGIPQSSSVQGLYTLSPALDGVEFSPNVGTFSPRPVTDSKIASIVEALGVPLPAGASTSPTSVHVRPLRALLERVGLTKDAILGLDMQLLAHSLFVFHKRLLKRLPDNITAELCLGSDSETVLDPSYSPSESNAAPPAPDLAPFCSSEDQPHWLTRQVLIQILVPEPNGGGSAPNAGLQTPIVEDRQHPTSRTHSRSEIISAWVRIGELCRRTGDECSWRAVLSALCSRPVARLDKVWKRVDCEALTLMQTWLQPLEQGGPITAGVLPVIPWAGDVRRQFLDTLETAGVGEGDEWQITPLFETREKFDALRTAYAFCTKRSELDTTEETDDTEALVEQWQMLYQGVSGNPNASKFLRVDQFMTLSFAAEPRRRGLFEPYYWTRPPVQLTYHPLSALLFPEPLPTVSFINRELATRGRLESNASSVNVQDLQNIRDVWLRSGNEGLKQSETTKPGVLDLGGTMLPLHDGELILLVQPGSDSGTFSRPSSRPTSRSRPPSSAADTTVAEKTFSRNPSIRIKPGAQGVDRKPSVIRRNSLPSISQRTSMAMPEVSSERPLRVVVQAGTLDRLVEILAHGLHGVSVSIADDNGEMPLNDKKTREVKVDMDDFSEVWWHTFRSFITPSVLFEFLRKRYLGVQLSQPPSAAEVAHVVRIRSEVLETMNEWVIRGGGAQDALDDVQLYKSFESFLSHPTEHSLPQGDKPNVRQAAALLDQIRHNLHRSFLCKSMRPYVQPVSESSPGTLGSRSFGSEPPDIDQIDAEELVNNLDAMASAAFRNVTQEDLFVTADLLEVQSADRTGWFLPREPNSIADEVEIQFMSSYIVEVEPSSMISELTQDTLYRLLPPSIRSCIRAFGLLRKWLVSKLVAFRLGLRARHTRMELMLRAIEVCRIRSAESGQSNLPLAERPCVRSFVEVVLTSAVVSVESRAYHRAWQNISLNRGTSCDSLSSLLSKPMVSSIASKGPLTVDVGWLIEKMLEIIARPDTLEATKQESLSLVNLDKRRSLHALINNPSWISGTRRSRLHREVDRGDFERLNNIEKEVSGLHFDLRGIREEAHREAAQAGISASKKSQRPFYTLIALQQEKIKRDRYLKDRLVREKRAEQQRHDKREEYLNKAMNPRRPVTLAQKQHRNKKSMSSAFFQFMRPISSAFSSESLSTTAQKPSLVLSVVDARVAQFLNNERSFTFELDTEDGGHYLLQALGKPEMKKWMDTIQQVSKTAAKRRLTYLGQDSKMQLSDHLLSPFAASRDRRLVMYGVDLEFLLRREAIDGDVQPGAVPSVVERLILEVENRGLTEMGIYRIAGAHSEVNAFRDALNRGEWPITPFTDIHAVCDLIKSWFRVLPGGIFPSQLYAQILEAVSSECDLEARLANLRNVVHALPDTNFDLLKRIVEHLERVTDYEENNQMTAESLATVFSPNILRPPGNDIGTFFANMSAAHRVTKTLIAHFHMIFDTDQDQEAELDQEQDEYEYEDPILEEDEDEDMLASDSEAPEQELVLPQVSANPPVLDINLGSPASFSFTMSSLS
ncbi:hypothetical protein B0H21DRAFT_826955 [Amylocystis lapponica]|nr:hypothetical protein B0H21DRAFT_826955 [Amylocystis lapponica]